MAAGARAEVLAFFADVAKRVESGDDEVPTIAVVADGLGVVGSGTQQQVEVEVTKLLVEVGHQVGRQVAEAHGVLTHHTILPQFFYSSIFFNAVAVLGRVRVHTHAEAHPPPVGEVGLDVEAAGEALGVVLELVVVEHPVGIFHITTT